MGRVTGIWVYQTLGRRPDPDVMAKRARNQGFAWITVQAIEGDAVLDRDWLRQMRRATKEHGLQLGIHGFIGRPRPRPIAEAQAMAKAIDIADADFAIVNAEIQYERSTARDSEKFVDRYRQLKPEFRSYFSSFGRPRFHSDLDWATWANGGFRGMPQAYENLNSEHLKPKQCLGDWARFFVRRDLRPTLGCFSERGHPHLPIARLVQSVQEVPGIRFNIYRHGTVTAAELAALSAIV